MNLKVTVNRVKLGSREEKGFNTYVIVTRCDVISSQAIEGVNSGDSLALVKQERLLTNRRVGVRGQAHGKSG